MVDKQLLLNAFSEYGALRNLMSNKNIVDDITSMTLFLDNNAYLKQRIWHILNQKEEKVFCYCGNDVKWNVKDNSYRSFCSPGCAHKSDSVRAKISDTCIKKYGAKTNLLTNESKLHYKNTMIERYGVDNPFKSDIIQNTIKEKFLEKYGVDNPSKLDIIKDKITATHEGKYNRKRQSQTHYTQESYEVWRDVNKLRNLYDGSRSILDIAKLLNIGHSQLCIHMKNLGIEAHMSVGQDQIFKFIQSIYKGAIIKNDRKILDGKEIDIYIPDLKIGFEYDGIFWHSELSSNKKQYHYKKDILAKSLGVKLFHITDFEWNNKNEVVKSRIASILGQNKRIYARRTEVKIIDSIAGSSFFEQNHIQGNSTASLYLGLFYEDNLVSAMSFMKSRYNKYDYELIRFSNILGVNVVGGASKLLKFATTILDPKTIVSFSDIRWGTGAVYEKIGFNHLRNNGPSYHYTKNYRTFENRVSYQKHKLKNILPVFDPNLSEWENMKNNGFDRYWDSGQAVYLWSNPGYKGAT